MNKHPTEPSGNEVIVYADGACSGNPGPAGIGVVMMWNQNKQELSEFLGFGTNNIAELTAILRALDAVQDRSVPVRVFTDSNYSIGVLTKGWKAKANIELIAKIKERLSHFKDVSFIHVRGHNGILLNERADQLAREAIQRMHSAGWQPI